METYWQSASLIQHPISASLARRQPHLAEIRRWRRQSVQMGRQIWVCLSRCNPWRDISRGVGNSSAQTVDDHVLVNGRTRKRSAAGGWSEAEVCAGELPLRWRPCMEENAAASGSCYWLGAPMRIGKGRRGRPWEAGIATSAGKESNLPEGSSFGKQLPAGGTIGKQQMLTAALTGRIS